MEKRTEVIAEIGQAHDGSLGILHSLIDAVAETGADTIKFQVHIAAAESSPQEPFRVAFSYQDASRFDYWKRMEFSAEAWGAIKQHCEEAGLRFLATPFCCAAVDLLENLAVERYKVGSGDVTNLPLLEKVRRCAKPVVLSSGMSSCAELDRAVELLGAGSSAGINRGSTPALALMQCTTKYPTSPRDVGLNVLEQLEQRYSVPVGLSDHSGEIYPGLAATTLGAQLVEVHVTFDKRMFGPDARASLTIGQLQQLVDGVRQIDEMLAHPVQKDAQAWSEPLRQTFGRTLAVNRDLPAGHRLGFDDLETKKPAGQGIAADAYAHAIGKTLRVAKRAQSFLQPGDLADVTD